MRIKKIVIYRVRLPLKLAFRHARSARGETENIIVEALTTEGASGFGEGVPREYVTGETAAFSMRYLSNLDYSFLKGNWNSFEDGVRNFEDWETQVGVGEHPFPGAARCALGLSLIDALTGSFDLNFSDIGRYVAGTLSQEQRPDRIRYSAVCSGGTPASTAVRLAKYRLYGFRSVKLKVGWGEGEDVALLRMARRVLGSHADLRVDANGVWGTGAALRLIPKLKAFGISAVEEPLKPDRISDLPLLRDRLNVPIMLDESVCSYSQMERALQDGLCDMVNVRLSKCGGFFSSLRIVNLLREKQVGYQLGCQVGESGILSAAGRHFAFMTPGLSYIEGSYDKHLLRENITNEDPTFGYGGWAKPITGPGLGVTVNREKLAKYAEEKIEISV